MTIPDDVSSTLRHAMTAAALDMAQMGLAMDPDKGSSADELAAWDAVHRTVPPITLPPGSSSEDLTQAVVTAGMQALTGGLLIALMWVERTNGREAAQDLLLHLRDKMSAP